MTSQALSGVIALQLVSREGSPSLLEVRHTHTHTHTHTQSVQRLLMFAPLAVHLAISQPSPFHPSFLVLQIYCTCAVQASISFTVHELVPLDII
jgi:hypothetical protein